MPLPTFSIFGDLLKYLRRRARLTQKDLSIATGYSESHISRLETNERPPDPTAIAALFVEPLRIKNEPETIALLVAMAETARGEPSPTASSLAPRDTDSKPKFPTSNLPHFLSSFVGRTRELEALLSYISSSPSLPGRGVGGEGRLVTLTGPGGVGKTRLALRAAEMVQAYPDGVWLVELAPLGTSALIPQTIASALSIQETRDRPISTLLIEFLRPRHLLLILDNCEHLIAEVAAQAETLLKNCSHLHILVTSREPLNLSGEIIFRVPPLRLPGLGWTHSLEHVSEAESVKLFVERAHESQPSFVLTEQNASAVAKICARLDGVPLAIELAAARVRHLTPEQIAIRLDDRFALLTSGPRDLPDRHRTLQAVMEWSYSLMDQDEQRLLNRLSVFAGSFLLEAVEAICAETEGMNLDILARLVDKSLVIAETHEGGMRYRLLETVRQYAHAKLSEAGDEPMIRACHAHFYLALAKQAEPKILSRERGAAIKQVDQEYDDLRCALDWSHHAGEREMALELVGALFWFWHFRGYITEGRERAEESLQDWEEYASHVSPGQAPALGKALWSAGIWAWIQGDFPHARQRFTASISILRETASSDATAQRTLAHALSNLGLVVLDEGDLSRASSLTQEAVALARNWGTLWDLALLLYNFGEVTYTLGDEVTARQLIKESQTLFRQRGDRWGVSISSILFGMIAGEKGDIANAQVHFEEALHLQRKEGDLWGAVEALLLLGQAAHQLGDLQQAAACYEESYQLNLSRVGDKRIMLQTLYSLGHLAMDQGHPAPAARMLGAYTTLQETTGSPIRRSILSREDGKVLKSMRITLGEKAFDTAWSEGKTMTLEKAFEFSLR